MQVRTDKPLRRDKAATRALLLETGYEMMLERGLEVGWGIRLADVTERVGLTTGAAYQIWNGSRSQHGSGGQDRFHRDLALYAVNRLITDILAGHAATSRALVLEGASLDRQIQMVVEHDFAVLSKPAESAVFGALIAAAATDPELAAASAESYRRLTERYIVAFEATLRHYELELVEPHTLDDLVVSIIALGDGLVMRSLVDPPAVPADHAAPHDAAPDATGSWHLFAIGARALIQAMTRPRGRRG